MMIVNDLKKIATCYKFGIKSNKFNSIISALKTSEITFIIKMWKIKKQVFAIQVNNRRFAAPLTGLIKIIVKNSSSGYIKL